MLRCVHSARASILYPYAIHILQLHTIEFAFDVMDDEAKLLNMGALFVLAKSDFISTFLARGREVIPYVNNVQDKVVRKLFERPVYTRRHGE